MRYNFDEVIDRSMTNSVKWNFNKKFFGYEDVLPMWVADMDFKSPPEVINAIIKRAEHGIFGYSDRMESYYDSVISWMEKRHNWNIEKEWLCTCPGVVPAINFIIKAFTEQDDKVIVQSPVYYPFYNAIKNNGCEIVKNPLKPVDDTYEMDFDDLEKKIDSRVKLLILSNPHNPVGKVWSKETLTKLGDICRKNNIIIISDEIHADLVYRKFTHIPFASISKEFEQNSITCTAPSKTFNLAGLHASNIIIPNENIRKKYLRELKSCSIHTINLFGIVACEAAYRYGEEWLEQLIDYLEENKLFLEKYVKERIPSLKVIKAEGTYLIWIDCRKLGLSPLELKDFMLAKAKIAFDEGYIFGSEGEGFERINIACPLSVLKEALERIEKAVNDHKRNCKLVDKT